MKFGNVKTTCSRKSGGGDIWKSGQAKKYAFQKFLGGEGVRVIWRNPDLTGTLALGRGA